MRAEEEHVAEDRGYSGIGRAAGEVDGDDGLEATCTDPEYVSPCGLS